MTRLAICLGYDCSSRRRCAYLESQWRRAIVLDGEYLLNLYGKRAYTFLLDLRICLHAFQIIRTAEAQLRGLDIDRHFDDGSGIRVVSSAVLTSRKRRLLLHACRGMRGQYASR